MPADDDTQDPNNPNELDIENVKASMLAYREYVRELKAAKEEQKALLRTTCGNQQTAPRDCPSH